MHSATDLALKAFECRPTRLEPLADLTRAAREAGQNELGAMFARRGLAISPNNDALFVETSAREALRSDLAVCGYYSIDPATREASRAECDALALDRDVSDETRNLARRNLEFHLQPIPAVYPSWQAHRLTFDPPDGYAQMAPSVTRHGDRVMGAARTINYGIDEGGYYEIAGHFRIGAGARIHTRTFLIEVCPDTLSESVHGEITMPGFMPNPAAIVQGFEDMRLISWRGELWSISTVLDQNSDGRAEQWLARIGPDLAMCDARPIYPEGPIQSREKNWMPFVDDARLLFVYWSDPTRIIDHEGHTVSETIPEIAGDHFRGSSQAIPFAGGWICVIHWVTWFDGWPKYRHRFAWFDNEYQLKKVSVGWVFSNKTPELSLLAGYEYCTGLCWHPDQRRFLLGYQIHEREAWIGTVDAEEVAAALGLPPLAEPCRDEPGLTLTHRAVPSLVVPSLTLTTPLVDEPNIAVKPPLDALDISRALEIEDQPRSLSPHRTIPQPPEKSGGSLFDDERWIKSQTNHALQEISAVDRATRMLDTFELPQHKDRPKNWDTVVALWHAHTHCAPYAPVLDAGGDRNAAFLPGLAKLGFKYLTSLNLEETNSRLEDGVNYSWGDITQTGIKAGTYHFVACLSVLEHGVNWRKFLDEACRILVYGGHLFISVDYWEIPVSTDHVVFQGSYAGQRWEIFTPATLHELVAHARKIGLTVVGDVDFRCRDKVISWLGADYTFFNILLRK